MLKKTITLMAIIILFTIFMLLYIDFLFLKENYIEKPRTKIIDISFMQHFKNIKPFFLQNSKQILNLVYQPFNDYKPITTNEIEIINKFCKEFIDCYSAEIELVIKKFEHFFYEPVEIIPLEQIINSTYNETINFTYLVNFVNVLCVITYYYNYLLNEHDKALKLSLLTWKLGNMLQHGTKKIPPQLFTIKLGNKIKTISITNILNILKAAQLDINLHNKLLPYLNQLVENKINFKFAILSEKYIALNTLTNEVLTHKRFKLFNSEKIGKVLSKLFLIDKLKNNTIVIFNENFKILIKIFEENKENLKNLKIEYDKYISTIENKGQITLYDKIFKTENLIYNLLAINLILMPNIYDIYSEYLKIYYYSIRIMLLCKANTLLKANDKIIDFPKTLEEFENIINFKLPLDYFNNKKNLNYIVDSNEVIIYSNGINLLDDNGNENEDIILFKISKIKSN